MRKPSSSMLKVGIVLFIVFLLAAIFWPNFARLYKLIRKNKMLVAQIEDMEKQREKINQEIFMLENEPVYIEKIARDELGLSRPDETIYKFEEEEETVLQ